GTFDDCQALVKAVAGDTAFKSRWRIGAVNSINWARVAAQVVYYFKGYFAATSNTGEKVAFAVPSGNFGNIFAAWVAREMGVPIGTKPPRRSRRHNPRDRTPLWHHHRSAHRRGYQGGPCASSERAAVDLRGNCFADQVRPDDPGSARPRTDAPAVLRRNRIK